MSSGFINYDRESELYNLQPLFREFIRGRLDSRNILFELAGGKDNSVGGSVAEAISRDFSRLPEDYRDILFELASWRGEMLDEISRRILETIYGFGIEGTDLSNE